MESSPRLGIGYQLGLFPDATPCILLTPLAVLPPAEQLGDPLSLTGPQTNPFHVPFQLAIDCKKDAQSTEIK